MTGALIGYPDLEVRASMELYGMPGAIGADPGHALTRLGDEGTTLDRRTRHAQARFARGRVRVPLFRRYR